MPFLDENFQFERVPETPSTILPEQHSPGVFKPLPTIELFKSLDIPSTQQDPKYSQTGEAFDWNQIIASTRGEVDAAQPKGFMFPIGELYENKRFPVYDPTIDNMEDAMGQAQSSGEKIVNGLVKFVGTTATTFVAGTLGTIVGMEEVLRTQKLSSFYNNPLAKRLDEISTNLEESYAHYKTARQQNASWYEYDNITSMNFLMDGIVKNLGFSLGAFGAGFAWSSALKAIGLTGRAVALEAELASKGAAGESAVLEANNIIASGALEGGGLPAINGKLSLLTRGKIIGGKILGHNNQNVVNTFATLTESGLEGFQAAKQYRESEIKKIKDSGREVTAEDLKEINTKADTVGNVVLGINSIILGINNNFQLPKIFSSSFKGDRHILTNTAFRDGFIQSILPEKGFAKAAYKTAKVAGLTFSKSEAYEEGAQFAAGTGTKHYYERFDKAESERNFLDDGLLYGIREALFSEEGQENIFIGGVSGAMQMSGIVGINSKTGLPTVGSTGAIGRRGWTGYGGEETKVREAALKEFKEISLNNKLKEAYAGIKVSAEIQGERENELLLGNEFEAKNLEYDYAHTYAISRIKYGAKELLDDEIQYVKQQASSTEGFDALKQMGVAGALDTQATFLKRIDSFQKHADLISKERELLNSKYGNMALPDGSRMYTDKSIDALVYTSGKIADINNRISQVSTELSTSGIDLFAIEQESKLDKSDLLKEEITKIKNNDALTIDEKETLIKTLTDYVRLNKSKRESIKEYNEIVDKPEIYSPKNKESVKDTTKETGKKPTPIEIKANKLTKTSKSETQKIIPGEEYYAGEVVKGVDKNGDEIPGVERFTVVGENEDGTIKIKDANGERDITKEYLESLKVESVKEAEATKKGKYFLSHIDHAFTYNLGKNRGGVVTGVLRYSTKKAVLIFEYKNSRGKTIQKEVKEDMFKAKAPFTEAIIVAIGPRTAEQIKSEEELQKEAEERKADTSEKRLGAMNSLITELQAKREKSEKLIKQKADAIAKARAKIEKLQDKAKAGEKPAFTESSMTAYSAAVSLSKTIKQLEQELLSLQDDIVEINMTIDYVESYKDKIENLPVEDKELLKQIKEEIEDLKELSRETVRQYNLVETLINKIKGALQTARDILKDLISRLGKANPSIPTEDIFGEDIYFDDAQTLDIISDMAMFPEQAASKELIEQVTNEQTAETIAPKEAKLKELNEELEEIQETLKEIDFSLRAMDTILNKFKVVQAEARAHAKIVANMTSKGGVYDQLLATQTPDIDTSTTHEALEADYKKEKTNVVIGGIAPTGKTGGGATGKYATRVQRFGNRFNEIGKTVKIRGVRVTYNSEGSFLPGLMAHLHPKTTVKELQKMVVIVVVNDKGELLDEFGKVIPKNTPAEEKLERAIYQVTPDSKVTAKEEKDGKVVLEGEVLAQYYSGGYETMFRRDVPLAEQIRLTKLYFAKKKDILKQKAIGAPVMIGASFGLLEYETLIGENGEPIINDKGNPAKNFKLRTSVVDAALIDDKTLQTVPSIVVSTKQERVTNGSVSFKARTGLVFLKVNNGLARLFNRKFTTTEGEVIADVLAQLATNLESAEGIKSPDSVRLLEYLKSTVYWGISHHRITGAVKEPGKNSVWFETDKETKAMTLFVGDKKNAFVFTSTNVKESKSAIATILTEMHNNTHNAFLQKDRMKVKYRQITGIDENGKILDVTWPNYQTYLLSNKKPDSKGKLTVDRANEEIPLTNNARPVKGKDDFNRVGIYFTMLDDLAYYSTGKKEPKAKVPTAEDAVEVVAPVLDGKTPNSVILSKKLGDVSYFLSEAIASKLLKTYKGVDIFARGNGALLNDFLIKLIKAKGIEVIIPDDNVKAYFDIEIKTGDTVTTIKTEQEAEVYAARLVVYKIRPTLSQHLFSANTKAPVKVDAPVKAAVPAKAKAKSTDPINIYGEPSVITKSLYGTIKYTFFLDAALEIIEKNPALLENLAKLGNALHFQKAITLEVTDENIATIKKAHPQLPEEYRDALLLGELASHLAPLLTTKIIEASPVTEEVSDEAAKEAEAKKQALADFYSEEVLEAPAEEMDPDELDAFKLAPDGTTYPVDRTETWTKVEAMLHKMAPGLAVYRVRNMIKATNGRQAFGMFRKAAIYIAQGAPAGTAYHEVFEAVWKSVTSRAEKVEILNEFRERPGYFLEHDTQKKIYYAEATDAELKEEVAEEFSKYILNLGESKPTTWLGRMFKAIKELLHTFFIGRDAISNTEELFKLIGDGYYAKYLVNEEGLSLAERGIQDIDYAEGDELSEFKIAGLTTMQEHDFLQEMTYSIYNILNKTSKDMLASTENINNAVYTQVYNDLVAILRQEAAIADNPADIEQLFLTLRSNWAALKAQHRIMLRPYDITFDEETEEIAMSEENASKVDSYNSNKIDAYKRINSVVKFMFATIPDNSRRSTIGGHVFVDSSRVFITLMNELHTSVDMGEMMARLEILSNVNPYFAEIYTRMTKLIPNQGMTVDIDTMTPEDLTVISGFWQAFKKNNPGVLIVYKHENGEVAVGDTNLSTAARQARYELTQNIIASIKEGNDYMAYSKKNKTYSPTEALNKINTEGHSLDGRDISNYTDFLEELGIHFDPMAVLQTGRKDEFIEAVDGMILSLKESIGVQVLTAKTIDSNNNLTILGEIQAVITHPMYESTFYSIDGEKTQTFIGTNHFSDAYDLLSSIDKLSQLAGTPLGYLLTDVFSTDMAATDEHEGVVGSLLMNRMFDPLTGDRLPDTKDIMKPVYTGGTIDMEKERRISSDMLNPRQRLEQSINLALKGIYGVLVPGDAELEHGIRMHGKEDPFVTIADIADTENGTHLSIFRDYIINEIRLSRDNRIVTGKRDAEDLRFFKDMLASDSTLHLIITSTDSDVSPQKVYEDNHVRINAALEKFFEKEMQETKTELIGFGLISKEAKGYTTELGFEERSMSAEVMDLQLKALTMNYIIANIELFKTLYSDPYQYSDLLKRIKNFLSPRVPMMDSVETNAMLHAVYNRDFEEDSLGWTDMIKNFFRTVVIGDVWGLHDLKDYNNQIDGYEETDGGGYITLKAIRLFKLKTASWTGRNELQYKHDVKFEELAKAMLNAKTDKQRLTAKEALAAHEKNNPGVADTYTPIKPIVAGSKANGRNYNDVILDKYALLPISYRLLYNMNPDTNMLKLYNKMSAEKIDYVVYNSGRKVGVEKTFPLYDNKGNFNDAPFVSQEETDEIAEEGVNVRQSVINVLHFNMGLQAEVPSKEGSSVTQGSQSTKLVYMDFRAGGIPVDYNTKELEGASFEQRFMSWMRLSEEDKRAASSIYAELENNKEILEERVEDGFDTVLDLLGFKEVEFNGVKGFHLIDRAKLIKTLQEELFKQAVNINIIDALREYKNNSIILEATPVYQQVRNIMFSIVRSNITRPKVTGGMKVQIPSTLFESTTRPVKHVSDKGTVYYGSDFLKFYSQDVNPTTGEVGKTNVAEIMVKRWFKTNLTDKQVLDSWYVLDENGERTSELTPEGKEALSVFAFRTPTQKQNSMEAYIIKGFLPQEYGDSVMVPAAMVKKSGSDFDIDKLSLYFKNLYKDASGKLKIVPFYGYGENAKEKFEDLFYEIVGEKIKKTEAIRINNEDQQKAFLAIARGTAPDHIKKKWQPILERTFENKLGQEFTLADIGNMFKDVASKVNKRLIDLTDYDLQQHDAKEFVKRNYTKSLENAYTTSLYNLTVSEHNFENLIKPNSAQELKDLTEDINRLKGIEEINFLSLGFMLSLTKMTALRGDFIRGKKGIAIAATSQTNHALNQASLIVINPDNINNTNIRPEDKAYLGDMSIRFAQDKYNSVNLKELGLSEEDKFVPTLSKALNAGKVYISDIIGMFIDGYVDISKGPWIMQMKAIPTIAGTWLYLIKIGVPIRDIAMFINQPMIQGFLKRLENKGAAYLFNSRDLQGIQENYQVTDKELKSYREIPSVAKLESNIKQGLGNMNHAELVEQVFMLKEFLKYSKMAEHLLAVQRGTDFDTAFLNDSFLIFQKEELLKLAQNTIFSAVEVNKETNNTEFISYPNAILKNTFIGKLRDRILNIKTTYSEVLISSNSVLGPILDKALLPYIKLNPREFIQVSNKAVSTFFDWATQTNEGFNMHLKTIMLGNTTEESAARQINNFRNTVFGNYKKGIPEDINHPLYNNLVLRDMQFIAGAKPGVPDNIKIKNKDLRSYDQNLVINSLEEIKTYFDNMGSMGLYEKIVLLGVLQSGLTNSPVAFSKLLPFYDFKDIYYNTLNNMSDIPGLDTFSDMLALERNEWSDSSIVGRVERRKQSDWAGMTTIPTWDKVPAPLTNAASDNKIPRVIFVPISDRNTSEVILHTWSDQISWANRQKKARTGNTDHLNKLLMRKVYLDKNSNIPYEHTTDEGEKGYLYVAINGWGDSFRAKEYYRARAIFKDDVPILDAPASVFTNGLLRLSSTEATDDVILGILNNRDILEEGDNATDDINDPFSENKPTEEDKNNCK